MLGSYDLEFCMSGLIENGIDKADGMTDNISREINMRGAGDERKANANTAHDLVYRERCSCRTCILSLYRMHLRRLCRCVKSGQKCARCCRDRLAAVICFSEIIRNGGCRFTAAAPLDTGVILFGFKR